jgi:PAS domain S-box-containing protein
MNIDLRTLILVAGITNFIQVVAIFCQRQIYKSYRGVGWWLLGFLSIAVGFIFTLLRDVTTFKLLTIIAGSTLTFSGPVFVYIGVMRFLNKKENRAMVFWLYVVFLLPYFYFTYLQDDINARSVIGAVMVTFYSFLTAQRMYFYKTRSIAASATFLSIAWCIQGCFFTLRSIDLLTASPITSYFAPTLIQASTFLFTLIISSLVTFGLILIVNQRSNAETTEAEKHFEIIFHASPEAVLISRLRDGVIVNVNEGFTVLTGFTKEDAIGRSTLEINIYKNPLDRQKIVNELVEKGFCENYEAEFQRKDGSLINGVLSAKIFPLHDIPHVISISRDVSETEKRFRTLFDQAAVGVSLVNTKTGRFISINQRYCDFLGYTREEMLNLNFQSITYPDDVQENIDKNALLISGKMREYSLEKRYLRKDGGVVWGSLMVSPLWRPDEAPVDYYHVTVVQDITERKRTADDLRRVSTLMNMIFENIPISIFLKDAKDLRFVRVNRTEEDLLGYTREYLVGKTDYDFFPKEQADFYTGKDREALSGNDVVDIPEEPLHTRNNETRILHTKKVPLLDANGEPEYLLGISEDITGRKQAEEVLQQKMDELLRFQHLTVGRELKMIELKKELNTLLKQTGKPEKYHINSDKS